MRALEQQNEMLTERLRQQTPHPITRPQEFTTHAQFPSNFDIYLNQQQWSTDPRPDWRLAANAVARHNNPFDMNTQTLSMFLICHQLILTSTFSTYKTETGSQSRQTGRLTFEDKRCQKTALLGGVVFCLYLPLSGPLLLSLYLA